MLSNITSNSRKEPRNRQSLLKSGDTIYLYGDHTYTEKLIHPVERTYPAKWTVQLDRGGFEAVNVKDISVVKSRNNQHLVKEENNYYEPDLAVPFSDTPETPTKPRPVLKIESKTPSELVAVDLIQPPKRRTRPQPPDKTTRPMMRPSDIIRNRTMLLVKSG